MIEDAELLRRYAEEGDQGSFHELVQRRLPFVYGAALRELAGASHRAEEVAQSVFIDLARKAHSLTRHPHLAGWLYRSAHFASAKLKRAEQRRQKREEEAQAMNDADAADTLNWDRLRPVLDDALHDLPGRHRTAILLRFFEGVRFAELGRRWGLSEDAARRRVDRALVHLRNSLKRRQITSTSSALALLLAQQPTIAVPAGLAANISSAAALLSPAPTTLLSILVMSKITAPVLTGAAAAALTFGVWTALPGYITAAELADLRQEAFDNSVAPATHSASSPSMQTASTVATAAWLNRQIEQRRDERAATLPTNGQGVGIAERPQHRNAGLTTPEDALATFAWASDAADADALAAMLWFDPDVREKALATMAQLPPSLIFQYPTPEKFYGFIIAALCLQAPPPGADVVERMIASAKPEQLREGRLRYPNRYELQHTPEGWKWVFPEVGVTTWLHVLGDSVLTVPPQT